MIIETKINLKNKTREELILLINEGLEIINRQNANKQKLIEKLEEDIKRINGGKILSTRSILKEILEILKGENDE